ncbi:MAG: DUF1611 domain-containing protein, partial [Desulfobacteraceae bacterium]|nr:DUF1611 domain-containing protein [Desulfobacteraceae bacterium]
TNRYRVLSVIDSRHAGEDAGSILDGTPKGIAIYGNIQEALGSSRSDGNNPTHFVIGLAPDGGRLSKEGRRDVIEAIRSGLNVDSGLHDFLSEDIEISDLALAHGVRIRDVRKTPPRKELHFFEGKIEEVTSLKVAVLGTDSAVGKRTTAWILLDALHAAGYSAEMIGTGQTAWMQGVQYCIILDSLINDFVSGEIEHAVWTAWQETQPDIIIIEGQGSLMNPAYPGGFEILAAGRPDVVILQHAPSRKDYDGFPGYPIHPVEKQIQAVELISGKPVVAVTVNRENMTSEEVPNACSAISKATGLPSVEVLLNGGGQIVEALIPFLKR